MRAVVVLAVGLALPGLLPALAAAGRSAAVVFLAPVTGALMAAAAAEVELGVGGSLVPDYVAVAAAVNVAVIAWWVARRAAAPRVLSPPGTWAAFGWSALAVPVMIGCLAVPLSALRGDMFGWDANSIWTTHALMVYGGHHELLTGLQNVAYRFTNPDYPPLVPAAGALAFKFYGLGNLHLAVDMTVLVTACGLGVVGMGIVAVADARREARWPARLVAVAAAGALCIVGFAVSGPYAVEGYADLVWAAFAVGAVIWGLVLPASPRALAVAWICAAAASLTKNEGLTTALVIIVAIALRYRPLSLPGPRARRWAERCVFVLVPALPGVAWAGIIRLIGIHDAFFSFKSSETPLTRASATIAGMAGHQHVAPLALAVLLAGCWFLRADRQRAGLANPAWLWICWLGSLAIIFATYLVGGLEIHGWLRTSVNRTTIFAQVVLYAEIAVWLVIAAEAAFSRAPARADRGDREPPSASEDVPEVLDGPREPLAQ